MIDAPQSVFKYYGGAYVTYKVEMYLRSLTIAISFVAHSGVTTFSSVVTTVLL